MEDHLPLNEALRLEIDLSPSMKCVGGFLTFEDALTALPKLHPDVLLLDIGLPGLDGIEGARKIKKKWPRLRILIFSALEAPEKILEAFNAGADGYLLKNTPRQDLAEAIESVHRGGSPISARVADELVAFFRRRNPLLGRLSPTEKLILDEFEKGGSYKEAAANLKISVNTVKSHVKAILVKTGTQSSAAAAFIRRQAI